MYFEMSLFLAHFMEMICLGILKGLFISRGKPKNRPSGTSSSKNWQRVDGDANKRGLCLREIILWCEGSRTPCPKTTHTQAFTGVAEANYLKFLFLRIEIFSIYK